MIQRNKFGLSAIVLSMALAGCSSAPTDESTDIEDTSVQTGQVDTSVIDDSAIEVAIAADTVFYFDYDKALLKPESRAALLEHAASLNNNPRSVRLEGHADERGTREYNMALGERRANAAKEFLVLQGVSAGLIEVVSYGEERAASYGSNDSAWSMNRRVELK
jgi:peptidoglycan-associated lipoprotein